jgi:hypothetical protein
MSETPAEWAERQYDEIQAARTCVRAARERQRTAPTVEEWRRASQAEAAAATEIYRRGGLR